MKNFSKLKIGFIAFGILCVISVIMAIIAEQHGEVQITIHTENLDQKTEKLYNLKEFAKSYDLHLTASGATEVFVNSQAFSGSEVVANISLPTPRTTVIIEAKNPFFKGEKEIIITRPLSEDEHKTQNEEKEKQELYAKQKEFLQKEMEKQSEVEKVEKEKLQAKYEKIAKNGHKYEILQELQSLGFKEIDASLVKSPDGSTQVGQIFEKTEGSYVIRIFITGSYDVNSHYYTVKVYHESEI